MTTAEIIKFYLVESRPTMSPISHVNIVVATEKGFADWASRERWGTSIESVQEISIKQAVMNQHKYKVIIVTEV